MIYTVYDSGNKIRIITECWPMARSALDYLISLEEGCPRLLIQAD